MILEAVSEMKFAMTLPLTHRRFAPAYIPARALKNRARSVARMSTGHSRLPHLTSPRSDGGRGRVSFFETASCYCYISRHLTGRSQGMTSHGPARY
jgi:hypothetical protein